jgi:hypothetical protein
MGDAAAARTTVCGAKQGFRDSEHVKKRGAPCVDCKCKGQGGKNGPDCTLYPHGSGCCQGQDPKKTPHHLIPKHCFYEGAVKNKVSKLPAPQTGCEAYDPSKAPCICASGRDKSVGQHNDFHVHYDNVEGVHNPQQEWPYSKARDTALDSMEAVEGLKGKCTRACIKAQLDNYHKERCCMTEKTKLTRDAHNRPSPREKEDSNFAL